MWGTTGSQGCATPLIAKLSSASPSATPSLPLSPGSSDRSLPAPSPGPRPGAAGTPLRRGSRPGLCQQRGACVRGRHPLAALSRASLYYMQTKRFLPLTCSRSGWGSREWGPGSRVRKGSQRLPGPGLEGRKSRQEAWEWGARERHVRGLAGFTLAGGGGFDLSGQLRGGRGTRTPLSHAHTHAHSLLSDLPGVLHRTPAPSCPGEPPLASTSGAGGKGPRAQHLLQVAPWTGQWPCSLLSWCPHRALSRRRPGLQAPNTVAPDTARCEQPQAPPHPWTQVGLGVWSSLAILAPLGPPSSSSQ